MIDEIITANPKQLEQYKGGKKTVSAFLSVRLCGSRREQANPAVLTNWLLRKLDEA